MGDDPFLKQAFSLIGSILGLSPERPNMLRNPEEQFPQETRRTPFNPRLPSTAPPPRQVDLNNIPLPSPAMFQQMDNLGLASDDPMQAAAALEAYRLAGYPDPNKPRRQ